MNILVVCGDYFNQSNGLCLSTQRFVKELQKLGETVRVLSSDRCGKTYYSVPVMRLPIVNGIMEKQNYLFAKPVKKVVTEALSWADVVHLSDPFPLSVKTVKLAEKMGIPMTGTFHLFPENITASVPVINFRIFKKAISLYFSKLVFNHCYAVRCPTEKVRDWLINHGYTSKLYVISNGIPEEYIARNYPEKNNKLFTIISTGRYSNEKDQRTLIEAVKRSEHSSEIRLILAGKGPLEEKYRKLGKELPNPPVMKFYSQEELRKAVREADLYVHAANVEVEGMGCMEAFATGIVPVIADSELSSTSIYALSSENRYTAGNVLELKERIDYWFENRELLPARGEEYLELARTLSLKVTAVQSLEMIKEAAKAGNKQVSR